MEPNAYEEERARRIAQNREKLRQLGVVDASRALQQGRGATGVTLGRGDDVAVADRCRNDVAVADGERVADCQRQRVAQRLALAAGLGMRTAHGGSSQVD